MIDPTGQDLKRDLADDPGGPVEQDGQSWDGVLLVRCPSRQAFSDMVHDPAYQAGAQLRTRALAEAVLQATVPW